MRQGCVKSALHSPYFHTEIKDPAVPAGLKDQNARTGIVIFIVIISVGRLTK